jgi:hypothetical protein
LSTSSVSFLRKIPAALLALLCLSGGIFYGCPLVSFEYLDISCSISGGADYFDGDLIRIGFSQAPDKDDVERQFKFYEKGAAAETVLSWEGSSLLVRPKNPWLKGQSYSLSLEGSLRMEDGRTYTARFYRAFIYGGADSFELTGSTFAANVLSLVFSKPPLITSFNEKFSLSPTANYRVNFFPETCTVSIAPRESWGPNVSYAWEVKNMESADGWLMRKESSGIFTGPVDTDLPRLLEICPVSFDNPPAIWHSGISPDAYLREWQGIGFHFSKPMDEASVKAGISFFPTIKGYFEKDREDRFIFIPEEAYRLEQEYRILVADTVKDLLGLSLFEPVQLFFTGAGRYLLVDSVTLDDSSVPLVPGGLIQDHNLNPVVAPALFRLMININFSAAIPPEKRKTALDSISLSVLFPPSAHNPALLGAYWFNGGSRLSLTWEDFSQSSVNVSNYYQLGISGGAKGPFSAAGEYLEEDLWFVFCTR